MICTLWYGITTFMGYDSGYMNLWCPTGLIGDMSTAGLPSDASSMILALSTNTVFFIIFFIFIYFLFLV